MIDFNGIPLDISPKINIDPFNVGLERKLKKIDDHRKKIIHEVYAKWFKTNNSDISNNGIYHNIAVQHDIITQEYNGGGVMYASENKGYISKIKDPESLDTFYGREHLRTGYYDTFTKWEEFKEKSRILFERVLDL